MHLRQNILGCVLLLPTLISAQSSTITAPSSTSSSPTIHTITVGKVFNSFVPDSISANVGDIVQFQFFPQNHTVVRAAYGFPCIPYELTGFNKSGFFSGFHPVDLILPNPPTWNLTINNTDPVFYYCSAIGSCINNGMVGVINPNDSVSLENQRRLAEQASYMLQPGQSFPAEASSSIASLFAAETGAPPAATNTAAPAASGKGLSTGVTIGIAVGSAALALLLAALVFFIWRNRRLSRKVQYGGLSTSPTTGHDLLRPPNSPNFIDAGDTIFVPIRRTDLRNSGNAGAFGEAPPYDSLAPLPTDLSRSTSPGNAGHTTYSQGGSLISDTVSGNQRRPTYTQVQQQPGLHEMGTPEMQELHANDEKR